MMKRILALALFFLVGALAAWAQADANKAQVIGTVTDPGGAVVPNAKVTVKNLRTGLQRDSVTSNEGEYRFVQLDPGSYEIVATSSGFAATTLSGLTLNVGSTVTVDIKLQVQATSTTVEVADTLINLVQPQASAIVNTRAIQDLPINGRRFQDFATLAPTVQVETSRQQLTFAGQRGINGNVMVDGADYNQPFFGGIRGGERSMFNFTVPQSAIQEFQAVPTGYSAEYGRSTGGVLNVITKSGANDYHGEAFYQNRDRSLSADNPIFLRQPSESLQQFGGAVGGPIKKDRLFFFTAMEGQRANTPGTVLFTALTNLASTPANQEALSYFRSLQQDFTRENRAWALTAKTDYQFSSGDRLTLRYNLSRSDEPNSVSTGGALNPFTNLALSNEGTEKDRTHFGTAQFTKIFSPRVVNDLKFSGSFEERPRTANSESFSVSAGPIGSYGTRSFLPTVQWDYRTQIQDALTLMAGRHTLKFGVDFSYLPTGQTFGFNQFGLISFNLSDANQILGIMGTANGNNRFDNPNVLFRKQIGNLAADYNLKQFAWFAQDSWRVGQRLTLDLGLRWEGQWNPTYESNNSVILNRVQGVKVPLGPAIDVTKVPNTMNQWAPRFGFAWTPVSSSRRVVVRGNTGLFYAATPLLLFSTATNNFRNPPGDLSIQIGSFSSTSTMTVYKALLGAGVDLNQYTLDKLPNISADVVARAAGIAAGASSVDPYFGANLTFFSSDFRNPRSFQMGLGSEFELTSHWVAGAQFHYVNTVYLQRNRDWNLPVPTVRAADGRPIYNRANRPIPSQGTFSVRESSARSLYRAVTMQTQYRREKFQAGLYYTLSTNYSNDDNERDSGGATYMNSFDLKPEYNYSNMDARHQLATHALYRLPWGIEVSGILRVRSGLPLNPVVGSDANGDTANTDRPYSAVGVPMLRNSFRNRAVVNNDLRLMKSFRLGGERMRLQLSAEMFNLLNLDNVVYASQGNIYGLGINSTTGAVLAPDARFMLLKTDGAYDTRTTSQIGNPFQAQFGVRFFF